MAVRPGGAGLPGRPRLFAPAAVIVLLLLVLGGVYVSQYTDYLWFKEAQHANVFSTVLKTKLLLFFVFGLLMAAVIGANVAIAYRNRPPFQPVSLEQQNLERYRVAIEPYLVWVLVVISAFFGVFAGLSAASRWQTWLLFAHGTSFGVKDEQFGKDISFFTFDYPFYRFLLGFVLVVLILSLLATTVTHYLFGGIRLQTAGEKLSVAARVHLSVVVGLVVAAKAVAYYLDRYGLAFSTRGFVQGGAGYTDVHAVLPAKTMLMIIAALCAILFFANVIVRNVLLPSGALALLVLSAIGVGGIYPFFVQTYQVKPNEVTKESTYIQRNIDATRQAYQIADVQRSQYKAVSTASNADIRDDKFTIPNIRLLDPNLLGPTFRQLQTIRPNYYGFNTSLDIDRYTVDGKTQDYVVAVRELDQSRLPAGQRNWINTHLTYTHGNGLVAAPANTFDAQGEPVFTVKNVPVEGPGGAFDITRPQIYYGEKSPEYSIVDTKQEEIDGPESSDSSNEDTFRYDGVGGVKLNTGFRKLLFALKFRDKNILLSSALTKDSKLMFIRNPADRVQKLAPFLKLDEDPYPAVVNGRILWIVDGYTTSSGYPYSQRTTLGKATTDSRSGNRKVDDTVNYIRNSVKATVDAYDGTVKLYTWDDKDPVLKTWAKAFPKLLLPKDQISDDLKAHFRYPEDYFKVQRTLLSKYHVTDPGVFYGGKDFWDIPGDPTESATELINSATSTTSSSSSTTTPVANSGPPQAPYYVLLQMPGESVARFALTTAFVANNGTNLTAFAAVSSDPGDDYGKIQLLELPKNTVIDGPGQVANTFESNKTVSTALSLLRQGGSEVKLGNLLTLPVGGGLLYVEPVYTQARKDPKFPLLASVIVSFGKEVAFQPTLSAALDELFGSGAGAGVPGPSTSPSPGTSPPASNVKALIAAAQKAYDDGQAALKRGDFTAYGQAQARLKAALDQLAARAGATATTSTASPTPSPSP